MTQLSWLDRCFLQLPRFRSAGRHRTRLVAKPTLEILPQRDGPTSLAGSQSGLLFGLSSGQMPGMPSSVAPEASPRATVSSPLSPTRALLEAVQPLSTTNGNEPQAHNNRVHRIHQASENDHRDWAEINSLLMPQEVTSQVVCVAPIPLPPQLVAGPTPVPSIAPVVPGDSEVHFPELIPIDPAWSSTPPSLGIMLAVPVQPLTEQANAGLSCATDSEGSTWAIALTKRLSNRAIVDDAFGHSSDKPTEPSQPEWRLDEFAAASVPENGPVRPLAGEAVNATFLTVSTQPDAIGQSLHTNTELFRVGRVGSPIGPLEVTYTLAGHGAGGTTTVNGSVLLPNQHSNATITAGPVLAASQPEVVTILLRDQFNSGSVQSTLFLIAPTGQIADKALLEAFRQGQSAEAFEALVHRYAASIGRISQQIVGNRADAEDISQYVFLRLARWQGPLPDSLAGWLRTVTRNASLTLLRSRRRRKHYERAAVKPTVIESECAIHSDERLDAAMQQLPAKLETAVRLRYLEGLSQNEAARVMGCPRGTLSRRVADGIQVLRQLLGSNRAVLGSADGETQRLSGYVEA